MTYYLCPITYYIEKMLRRYNPKKERYPYVESDLNQWPLVKLTADRINFLKEVNEFAAAEVTRDLNSDEVSDEIARTIYLERKRAKEDPWRVDPKSERKFWSNITKELVKKSLDNEENEEVTHNNSRILGKIIDRYSSEIAGSFRIKTYRFARTFLTMAFTRLLNSAASKNIFKIFSSRYRLQEKIQAVGEIELIRELSKKGTVVIVPTHFSNLDSILIGLTVDFIGIPAVSYGAGLNLFNEGVLAYFMNRLGAYRIDRRKKNKLYLATLKAYSNLSIQRGTHSLFFPGGTRARSGMIEKKLKLGMLGSVIDAQRGNYESGKDDKIFIVPMVLGYHFVLEAKSLIEQHLKREGEEKYLMAKDEFNSKWSLFKFVWNFFSASSEIIVSFGKPIDVFGNQVNENGESLDSRGQAINIKEYFESNGVLTQDFQRDSEYTKLLANKIVDRLHRENIVLSSHVIAFTAFQIIKKRHPKLDIYGIMRLSSEDCIITSSIFQQAVELVVTRLKKLEKREQVKLSPSLHENLSELIQDGIKHLGIYHPQKVLKLDKQGNFTTSSLKLLYYYHNHLVGYNLEKVVL